MRTGTNSGLLTGANSTPCAPELPPTPHQLEKIDGQAQKREPVNASSGGSNHARHSDAGLIEQCLDGDRKAWATLLERYSGLIYSIARRSKLSSEDVADVFQSVSLALLEELGKLRDRTKLNSWLTTVTVHQCMRLKRQRAYSSLNGGEVADEFLNVPDHSILPDEVIEKMERQQLVRQALSMLDEPCRRLLTQLFFEDNWSYKEIAEEMGVAVSTIGPKRCRCLKRLLHLLTRLGL